jgi:hypothetical protein
MTEETPRFEYAFHPLADKFPMMQGEEFIQLGYDIKANGLREPITLFEGKILDGRNRYDAAKSVGYRLVSIDFVQLKQGVNPEAFVISANIHRRHLTAKQKRDLLAELIKADPTKSDRQIGAEAKVDNKTVGKVREELETTEEIPQLETRVGKDGKKRKKKAKAEVDDDPPVQSMKKYKTFLDTVLDALEKWPKDREQAGEWHAYAIEKLDDVMAETWPEPEAEAA